MPELATKKTRSLLEESYQGNDLELVTIKAPQFDPVKAEPIVQRIIQLDPTEPANYFALANIYEQAGEYADHQLAQCSWHGENHGAYRKTGTAGGQASTVRAKPDTVDATGMATQCMH